MAVQGISGDIRQWSVPSTDQLSPDRVRNLPPAAVPPLDQSPPYNVTISSQAQDLAKAAGAGDASTGGLAVADNKGASSPQECQTCKNRKYVDRSDDATVSFQTPTRLSPGGAESAVRAHEQEHVTGEQAKAEQEGRKVVSQTVTIHYGTCPECGRSYVSGGTTTTVTRAEVQPGADPNAAPPAAEAGASVDLRV